jgi:NADH-quinone oxidoreductase subunit L
VADADAWLGLAIGAAISIAGIALAYLVYVARPGIAARLSERARGAHTFLANKWYWDELLDALVYRPTIAAGRFADAVLERFVVNGLVNGTVGAVRGVGSMVRGAQSGFIRAYALLLVTGFAALGLYFLVVSS